MKKCYRCKEDLSLENFHKDKSKKDRLDYMCKNCRKIKQRKDYVKNLEKIKIRHKKYRAEHAERERKRGIKYYKEHIEEEKKRSKKYYLNNLKKTKERHKKFYLKNPDYDKKHYKKNIKKIQERRFSLKGRDVRSKYKFNVTISDMLEWQDYKCAICQEVENGIRLHVDHDHITGQIRMLLCHGCNLGNGITDNWQLLLAKSEYIKTYSS